MRFFPVLVRDLITDFLELDSRFFRTLKPLLAQPGKLTRDYLGGQRFRYTPPLRLYIFSSMAFFILAAMLAGGAISISSDDEQDKTMTAVTTIKDGNATEEEIRQAREALDRIKPGLGDRVIIAVDEAKQQTAEEAAETTGPESATDTPDT